MMENNNNKKHKGGRTPKSDPSIHRHVFRLTDTENAKLREFPTKQNLSPCCCSARR
jgi:hypothetical protein